MYFRKLDSLNSISTGICKLHYAADLFSSFALSLLSSWCSETSNASVKFSHYPFSKQSKYNDATSK
ncbi:hypothetical protein T4D_15805 [Trichinella pseudospiralis]|uniref:Uncharacterized protein n=1 Tax=Trichinella pseudospiralis TaxID=6337 RepID=A0A0V1FY78_TRIPS|nr:hypothetical protein T4D_15805 [Trichinella pseudospiralis]